MFNVTLHLMLSFLEKLGHSGPIAVTVNPHCNIELTDLLVEASENLGIPENSLPNTGDNNGNDKRQCDG